MRKFTLEYWMDEDGYVGRLKGVPGVFSQGETLEELEENVKDAYRLMMEDVTVNLSHIHAAVHRREIDVRYESGEGNYARLRRELYEKDTVDILSVKMKRGKKCRPIFK